MQIIDSLVEFKFFWLSAVSFSQVYFVESGHSALRLRFRPNSRQAGAPSSSASDRYNVKPLSDGHRGGAPALSVRTRPAAASHSRSQSSSAPSGPPAFNGPITVDADGFFVDALGRRLLFHGSNSVQKSVPWVPTDMLRPEYLANLSLWGFNVMRLGIMWAGVEPQEGRFNLTYIETMKGIVQTLGKQVIVGTAFLNFTLYNNLYQCVSKFFRSGVFSYLLIVLNYIKYSKVFSRFVLSFRFTHLLIAHFLSEYH